MGHRMPLASRGWAQGAANSPTTARNHPALSAGRAEAADPVPLNDTDTGQTVPEKGARAVQGARLGSPGGERALLSQRGARRLPWEVKSPRCPVCAPPAPRHKRFVQCKRCPCAGSAPPAWAVPPHPWAQPRLKSHALGTRGTEGSLLLTLVWAGTVVGHK